MRRGRGVVCSWCKISKSYNKIYIMLFAGWEVRIVKNCDRGRRPRAAFSRPRSQFFTIRTDPKPVNNFFFSFLVKKNLKRLSCKM